MSDGDEIIIVDSEGRKVGIARGDEYEILDKEEEKEEEEDEEAPEEENEDEPKTRGNS
jgi:hypothetical protein